MNPPTVTMHQPPPDNRPPPPETATLFVVVYAEWSPVRGQPRWLVVTSFSCDREFAEKMAARLQGVGKFVYGIAEITATRREGDAP